MSRVTGLVRERALAAYLGTSGAADAFTAAFRIPNLLQHLLGEGVLSASFIPVYSRLLAEGREREAGRVAGAVVGLLSVAVGVLVLVGVLAARPLTLLVAPGFARDRPEVFDLTVDLVRVLFPAVGLLVLSAWCLGVLNSHRRFFLSYVAPALLNVVQIGVLVVAGTLLLDAGDDGPALLAAQADLVRVLAYGTIAGGAAQLLVQLPTTLRVARGLRPAVSTAMPEVREVVRSTGPVVAARGVVQISGYLEVVLASFLAAGALATLRYGQILYLLPISLFAMSVAAAELPELSRRRDEARELATRRLQAGLARIAVLVVPTLVAYLVLGDLVVAALFQTGQFDRPDTVAVWVVLAGYSVGLLATTSSRLLQSAMYAAGNTSVPARLATARVLVSLALGSVLMLQADRVGVDDDGFRRLGDLPALAPLPDALRQATGTADLVTLGAAGLSVAAGAAAWLEYVLLRRAVRARVGRTTLAGGSLGRLLLAAGAAALAGTALRPLVGDLWPPLAGVIALGAFGVVYVVAARVLGVTEVREVLAAVLRRRRR